MLFFPWLLTAWLIDVIHDFESVKTHSLPFQFLKLCCVSKFPIPKALIIVLSRFCFYLASFYLSLRNNEIKYEGSICNFIT